MLRQKGALRDFGIQVKGHVIREYPHLKPGMMQSLIVQAGASIHT